jgi:hypothetical protein
MRESVTFRVRLLKKGCHLRHPFWIFLLNEASGLGPKFRTATAKLFLEAGYDAGVHLADATFA